MMMLVAEKEWDDVVDDVVDDDVDALPMIAKENTGSAMSKIYFLSDDVTVGSCDTRVVVVLLFIFNGRYHRYYSTGN
jgi:hypothetical protein